MKSYIGKISMSTASDEFMKMFFLKFETILNNNVVFFRNFIQLHTRIIIIKCV